MEGGYFLHTGVLFDVARQAYARTENAPSDTSPDQKDAYVAVLFSAATLESFIMEFALNAHMGGRTLSKPE